MAFSHSAEYAVQPKCIFVKFSLQSPFIFRTHMSDPQLFQNCDLFQYYVSLNQNKVSWCIIEKNKNFERTEDCANVFLKWTDFMDFFGFAFVFAAVSTALLQIYHIG